MTTNRGLTVAQAKNLASSPNTAPGVLARLANTYPETWPEILGNPNLYPELKSWVEQAMVAAEREKNSMQVDTASKAVKPVVVKVVTPHSPAKAKSRGRRRHGKVFKTIGLIVPAGLAILGLVAGVGYLKAVEVQPGIVISENLEQTPESQPAWSYNLAVPGENNCAQFSLVTLDQDQAVVLTQNDIEKKSCRDKNDAVPSTLALLNLEDGKEIWKVDLTKELDWTEKWKKQIVELPGQNEIIVKFTDVNGSDAGGNLKVIDKNDDRKMKTIVPYSRLNGRITDPVIAKSKSQPIMQAPVLNVLAIPGNIRSILVMTSGAKKDFRYAKYRSKRLSSPRWSVESDQRPIGGTQIVGNRLVLGREEKSDPTSININSGKFSEWNGKPGVKIYNIGGNYIQISGDGVTDKATNIQSQGGLKGNKVTIEGIDLAGNTVWSMNSNGYAISKDDSYSDLINRKWFTKLYTFDGKDNRFMSLIDSANGNSVWRTKLSKTRFEISRTNSSAALSIYFFEKFKLNTKQAALINLEDGTEFESFKIASKQVRVDGASSRFSLLIDEPERARIIKAAESGKEPSASHEDGSDETRKCIQAVNESTGVVDWVYECNGNQHIIHVGGRWLVFDASAAAEKLWPLTRRTQ